MKSIFKTLLILTAATGTPAFATILVRCYTSPKSGEKFCCPQGFIVASDSRELVCVHPKTLHRTHPRAHADTSAFDNVLRELSRPKEPTSP